MEGRLFALMALFGTLMLQVLQIREQESSDIHGGDELRSMYLYTINE